MASLGDIQQNAQGIFKLTADGWVPISAEQAIAETAPGVERFARGAVGFPTSGSAGALGQLTGLGAILGPGAAGIARGARGLVANRVAGQIEANVAARQLVRRPSNIMGRATTAGSAARLVEAGAEAVPGLNIFGLAQKAVNQRRINESFARAVGLGGDDAIRARAGVTEDLFDSALTAFNNGFRQVERAITPGLDQTAARAAFDTAKENGFVVGRLAGIVERTAPITGREVMALRSELAAVMRSNESFLVKNQARAQIEALDDIIARSLAAGDDAIAAQYQALRSRWRIWASAQKGAGISADGQINPRSMSSALRRNLGDNFRAGRPLQGAPQEVNDYLAIIREGASLDVGLPSSGTAERAAGAAILGGLGIGALSD
jgi:hypothetical protein